MENFFIIHSVLRLSSQHPIKIFLVVLVYYLVLIYTRAYFQLGKEKTIQNTPQKEKDNKSDNE